MGRRWLARWLPWGLAVVGLSLGGCTPTAAVPGQAARGLPAGVRDRLESSQGQPPASVAPPAAAPAQREAVTLAVVGDIMLARGVDAAMRKHGVFHPFARVAGRLRAADYAFANLESPLGVAGRPVPGKGIWFRARPEAVAGLVYAGIDGVTVANNHILDYDAVNFLETLAILRRSRIGVAGGGEDLAAARRPLLADVGGVRVAFLGYSQFADIYWDRRYPRSFAATQERPGVAPAREELVAEDVYRARRQADVVIVAYHWGDEYVNHPNEAQRRLARRTVELGADVVLGFHPHAVQGIRWASGPGGRRALIAYSLGNFVMDQRRPVTRESMILELTLSRRGVLGYNVVPVLIEASQPRILDGEEARPLLDKIRRISTDLGRAGPLP